MTNLRCHAWDLCFVTGFHYVAQVSLKLAILLPQLLSAGWQACVTPAAMPFSLPPLLELPCQSPLNLITNSRTAFPCPLLLSQLGYSSESGSVSATPPQSTPIHI